MFRFKAVFVIATALLISSCDQKGPKQEMAEKMAIAAKQAALPPIVEVMEVMQKDIPIAQEWIGTLDGMVNAQILAQVTGYLIRQNYQEGQLVKKGQLLYEIDPRTFQAKLDQALSNQATQEALLKTATLDMVRVEKLLPENAVSVRDRDNAVGRVAATQAQLMAAKAVVENARLELGFTKITSPIEGIAGVSQTQLGNLVGPGSANAVLTTVSQVNPIRAYIYLSEQEYLSFARSKGINSKDGEAQTQTLELYLSDGTLYPRTGKFFFADREVGVKTGTIRVAALFPNPYNLLRPGQYARVRAVTKTMKGALLVPQRSVTDVQGKHTVAVVNADNTVNIRIVETGETVGSNWIVKSGLNPGDRIVVEGVQKLKEGIKVNPKNYQAPASQAGS